MTVPNMWDSIIEALNDPWFMCCAVLAVVTLGLAVRWRRS